MSFILNALRKSEQERASTSIETLEGKIQFKQGATQKNKSGWLVTLVMINLLLLAFLFTWQEEKSINKEPVSVAEQVKTPLQIKQQNPVQVQAPKPGTAPQITIAQQVKNHQEKQKEDRKRQASLKAKQIPLPIKTQQATPIAPPKIATEQPAKAKKPMLVVSNKENDLPYLSDMPYEFSLSVPNININVFVYTEHPEGRFIMIDMQKYQGGQQINKDMKLHEIRSESIVVEYKDKGFQIQR